MVNPATTADIVARWRPLESAEEIVAATRLGDAWRKLKRYIPSLEARIAADEDLEADTVRVLSDAVIRVLQNPEGIRRGTVSLDDASRTVDYGGDSARVGLYFTEDELSDLSPIVGDRRARAFSVQPS